MLTKETYTELIKGVETSEYTTTNEVVKPHDLKQAFKQVLRDRMEHCESELRKHISEAVSTNSRLIICWKTGHFSHPVYEHMRDQITESYESWDRATWQQVIRHLFLNKGKYGVIEDYLFNYATEMILILSDNEY